MIWKKQQKAEAEKVAESLMFFSVLSVHTKTESEIIKPAILKMISQLNHEELRRLKEAVDYLKKTESEAGK